MKWKYNFYFEKIGEKYFISNDSGEWLLLNEMEFKKISQNKISYSRIEELKDKNFMVNGMDFYKYSKKISSLRKYIYNSPSLHIIVLTLRCNHFCRYCRAVGYRQDKDSDMSIATLKKSVDFIFKTPNKNITIEFQGGESLLNLEVLKKGIEYIKKLEKKLDKDIEISVVTNLSIMNDEILNFLFKNKVSICTSLDGPEFIHNNNRLFHPLSSHKIAVYWLKKIMDKVKSGYDGGKDFLPSALMTTTRLSLSYYKEIVNEYRKLKLGGIFLRPLSPIGHAKEVWNEIGYGPKEFLEFYENALDYIIELNLKGEIFIERNAAIKLKKILFSKDPNYLDLRSPCGAAMGQLAYNYDGSIYTCDEGRMVGAEGDNLFKVGDVYKSSYKDIINSPASRLCAMCSNLENQFQCFKCAFKPYCGVCPVHNYETASTPWGDAGFGGWCDIEKGIFKILIRKLQNRKYRKIFERWFDA
jgi:His-Xaa-Ser system radical SAM maturase HxsB